jgi:tRNA dimethylallyltransferase
MKEINQKNWIITLLGPTASGKTKVAATLAQQLGGEVIGADSRQVYREMDMGTGKDYADYIVEGVPIPFHLVDIKEPGYKYNLFEYQQDFYSVYANMIKRGKVPVLCGGTGLYIEAATKGYKMRAVPPDEGLRKQLECKTMDELAEILRQYRPLHNTSDIDTKKRAIRAIEIEKFQKDNLKDLDFPELKPLYFGIKFERQVQRQRITERLQERLENGMVAEVEKLLDKGIAPEDLTYYGLEYKCITLYLTGKLTYNDMFSGLNTAIHQFAKRQMTWFRRMERNGDTIHWFDGKIPLDKKIKDMLGIIENVTKQ